MQTLVVRPSLKLVYAWYVVIALLVILAAILVLTADQRQSLPWIALPLVLLFIPVRRHIQSRLVTLTVGNGRLTLDKGLVSRSTRTVDLAKIQDVTVRQSVWQRMLGLGELSLETAGETGFMSMPAVDRPREVADAILSGARQSTARGQAGY